MCGDPGRSRTPPDNHHDDVSADDRAQDDDHLCAYEHDLCAYEHDDDSRRFDIDDTRTPPDEHKRTDDKQRRANDHRTGYYLVNSAATHVNDVKYHVIRTPADIRASLVSAIDDLSSAIDYFDRSLVDIDIIDGR